MPQSSSSSSTVRSVFHATPTGLLAFLVATVAFVAAVGLPVFYFGFVPALLQARMDAANVDLNLVEFRGLKEGAAVFAVAADVGQLSGLGTATLLPGILELRVAQPALGHRLIGRIEHDAAEVDATGSFFGDVKFVPDDWGRLVALTTDVSSAEPLELELSTYDFSVRMLGKTYGLIFSRTFSVNTRFFPTAPDPSWIQDATFEDRHLALTLAVPVENATPFSLPEPVDLSVHISLDGVFAGKCHTEPISLKPQSHTTIPIDCKLKLPLKSMLAVLSGGQVRAKLSHLETSIEDLNLSGIELEFEVDAAKLQLLTSSLTATTTAAPSRGLRLAISPVAALSRTFLSPTYR